MKKLFLGLVLICLVVGIYLFNQSSEYQTKNANQAENSVKSNILKGDNSDVTNKDMKSVFEDIKNDNKNVLDKKGEVRPAVDIYKTSQEALKAIMDAAKDYDDLVLEQFSELPENCSWCTEFYSKVNEMMLSEADDDVKSYYAEVLSVSGRVENIATLINAAKEAGRELDSEIFAEAIEISIGGEELVEFLGDNINDSNELVAESVLAALTNHGSRKAVEKIYEHTRTKGDPDGFYSLGIGLGEIIPDEESFPYLREIATKKDQYSHLAIKSLLNAGDSGLRQVVDIISSSPNSNEAKALLKDAVDHVAYDTNTEQYVNDMLEKTDNPAVKEFLEGIKDELEFDNNYEEK